MSLTLRYMRLMDVPQVVQIDKLSFPTPWTAQSYRYEITESNYSFMAVLEQGVEIPLQGWRRLIRNLNGSVPTLETRQQIVGTGGLWCIAGEAHISTIASHPDFRGQGFGEVVLAGMIRRAICLGGEYIVLEVRVSNLVAQRLYKKYDFEIVDTKTRYYRDNGEDAYDMRLDLQSTSALERFQARFEALQTQFPFKDLYTDTTRPTK